jgi:cysteine desulfurase
MDLIYLDNSSTTPVLPEVVAAMEPYHGVTYGNPASAHRAGRHARRALEDAREQVAALLDCFPDEVVFTSGATEANNFALFGLAGESPAHIVISAIEHPSVSEAAQCLSPRGFVVTQLPVTIQGIVKADVVAPMIRLETRIVSVMLVNNETGAIQPVKQIVKALGDRASFHCDAVQAIGKVPLSFRELGVTTLSLSAHKFYGPKGIGALLVKRDCRLQAQLYGGHQQHGKRPGTEPVALAVGLATALKIACRDRESNHATVQLRRRQFLATLRDQAAPVCLNGSEESGVPHILNISFPGCRADSLLMNLDLAGVACSTGSACSSGSLLPSPVLKAMHVPDDVLHSAMRFSFSAQLKEHEIDEAARRIVEVVRRLRTKPLD